MPSGSQEHLGLPNVLLLGLGGKHGREYKLGIVEKLRSKSLRLVVVEEHDHWATEVLNDEIGVDETILLPENRPHIHCVEVIEQILKHFSISPNAVVTYRQEWLLLRSLLTESLQLPGPKASAVETASSKYQLKLLLQQIGLNAPDFALATIQDLQGSSFSGAPVFIRPNTGIRSEWARAIVCAEDYAQYIADVNSAGAIGNSTKFLVEPIISGHEVDADFVLYEGSLRYGKISDNLPTRFPYALETGHVMPSVLSAIDQERLLDAALKATLACGFTDGNIHAELFIRPDGEIFIIEINARMGGMYIADWHEKIWGVDLVLAELAIALGQSPVPYLQERDATSALAQVCLSLPVPENDESKERAVSLVLSDDDSSKSSLENWYQDSEHENVAMSGTLNLGSITTEGRTPEAAWEKLAGIAYSSTVKAEVDGSLRNIDLSVMNKFCLHSPRERYRIRDFQQSDTDQLKKILQLLSPNANVDAWANESLELGDDLSILCAEDTLRSEGAVVGTISIHFWKRMRPKPNFCAYLCDLIVLPPYRGSGIAKRLLENAMQLIALRGCYKTHLDCSEDLQALYTPLGFTRVADCMVRYADRSPPIRKAR